MRIEFTYENLHIIPEEYEEDRLSHRKKDLNMIERVGLQEIALSFIEDYETQMMGESMTASRRQDIRDVLRWCTSAVDILDGFYDTYEFDGYLFGEVWMTNNGIPMLTAWEIPEDCEDWMECDFRSEFKGRIFRLN